LLPDEHELRGGAHELCDEQHPLSDCRTASNTLQISGGVQVVGVVQTGGVGEHLL
jgi:hypothetical protein